MFARKRLFSFLFFICCVSVVHCMQDAACSEEIRSALADCRMREVIKVDPKITIVKEIAPAERYGVCHHYAFSRVMDIVGKPNILNVAGRLDYFSLHFVDILRFFSAVLDPQPGDIAIYTLNNGLSQEESIRHTGFVVENGYIESKWGVMKAIFRHPVWHVPSSYGNNIVYMRTKYTGKELLQAIEKRLSNKNVKKRYDKLSLHVHKTLFAYAAHRPNVFMPNKNYYANNVYELLERNMNVCIDQPDEEGRTALMLTAAVGDKACARLLLRYGANINHQDNNGDTALILAFRNRRLFTASFLIQRGADKKIKNQEGKTAVDYYDFVS